LLLTLGSGAPGCRDFVEPPPHLLGRWVTTAPAYQGRYFEVRPQTLTIETKTGPTFVYSVLRFEIDRSAGRLADVVHYRDRDPESEPLELRLVRAATGDDSRLRIEHHPEVWTRVESGVGGVAQARAQ
jgi:hypothetical protein